MKKSEELLVIEPIIGYRSWNIYCEKVKGKFNFYLRGSGIGATAGNWQKGVNEAKCLKTTIQPTTGVEISRLIGIISHKHKVPEFNCECGFYAHKYKIDIIKELLRKHSPSNYLFTISIGGDTSDIDLYGTVELTGKVIEHSEGYRAEKVEIKKLIWADERDKIEISYKNKEKKAKDKNNNIQSKTPTATAVSLLRTYNQNLLQQMQQARTPNLTPRGVFPSYFISDDLTKDINIKNFTKEQIIKSLQDYYQVSIIYYKDYLEKELLK